MATILQEIWNLTPDARTDDYLMLKSNWIPLIIVLAYYLFVKKIGPQLMEDKKPYDLKGVILAYNAVQIISNVALFIAIFYVLRKKHNQISVLHLYHHISMVVYSWFYLRYFPGGQSVWLGYANTLTHTIMYSYYFITAWDESHKKKLWWKKYITQLQLAQQFFVLFTYLAPIFVPGCEYPLIPCYLAVVNAIIIVGFFLNFYVRSYLKSKRDQTSKFK